MNHGTSRKGRGHWTTVVSDALDHAKFSRWLEGSSKLQALQERGLEVLPTFGGLSFDLFAAFLYPKPVMRPAGVVLHSHRLNANIVKQLMELPEYKEIHPSTQMDDLLSAMAVLEVSEAVLAIITKEEEEQIRQIQEQEEQLEQLQDQADQAQDEAVAAQQQANQAQNQAQASGSAQDRAAAQQAQAQVQAAQQRAQQAMHTLEEARQRLEGMASELSQQMSQPERQAQMRQAVRQAVEELSEQVSHEKDMLELWGFDPGQVKEMDYETVKSLADQLAANKRLMAITEILGGLKPFWKGRLREKEQVGVEITDEYYLGSDLLNVHPAELVELADPDLEDLFHLKFATETLFCVRTKVRVKLGEGPVVVKRDRSGSMEGDKEYWATALELTVTNLVTRDRRATCHIWFTAKSEPLEVVECLPRGSGMQAIRYQMAWQADGTQSIIPGSKREMTYFEAYVYIATQGRAGGGTEFDPPVRWGLTTLDREEFSRADILLLTDGHADLPEETVRRVNQMREEEKLHFLSVLINVGLASEASVRRFSDVKSVTELTVEEAGEIVKNF